MKEAIELAKRVLVDSIWKSANLEGLGTTFPKTEMILKNIPTETKTEEVLFILNMRNAWKFLLEIVGGYSNCIMLLREFNKLVGENLFYENGKIRTGHVSIGGTDWIPDIPIEGVIYEKLKELNSIEDVELKALKYFCYVARTQMFPDGNKRVAQLIANKILIENNIGIFQVPVNALEEFISLLIYYYETDDDESIINFMKKYCIVRVSGKGLKYNKKVDSVSKFEDSLIENNFRLSESQVNTFNKVLFNIRRLLKSRGYKGSVSLVEENGVIQLITQKEIFRLDSTSCKLLNKGLPETDTELFEEFIYKTILLLNKNIPLYIKTLKFTLSDNKLVSGEICKSESEKGSVNINLY